MTLEQEYKKDPELLAFYQKKLLDPGWAGGVTDNEARHISSELQKSSQLRILWRKALRAAGYPARRSKRPSPAMIKAWSDYLLTHTLN